MALTQVIVFAVLQGLTAVFPIGASAHWALLQRLTGWQAEPRLGATAQAGILLAVMAYFWRDLADMAVGLIRLAKGKREPGARLALQLLVASIPAIGLALVARHYLTHGLASLALAGWISLAAAVALFFFDRLSMTVKRIEHATYVDTVLIGVCQVFAFLPGASRAGPTMTMARLLGYERDQAVRFSMLLAIPSIIAVIVKDVIETPSLAFSRADLEAAAIGFFVALISLAILMAWLRRATFAPFVIYRCLIAAALLILAYGWITP